MKFQPIAIVGQGCVLPGALNPDELWQVIINQECSIQNVPDNYWELGQNIKPWIHQSQDSTTIDKMYSSQGGYIQGFDKVFSNSPAAKLDDKINQYHIGTRWSLYACYEALKEAGLLNSQKRGGLIMGNLSYPTTSLINYARSNWKADDHHEIHPENRFMSGLAIHYVAKTLGLEAGSFALDAACASSLYAIKLAADWLSEGKADIMLAGGLNTADDLFIHMGFTALQALSKSGQSSPFQNEADGLVPAEGAAVIALMKLEDALKQNIDVLGVIRGVGLSNDGNDKGALAPSEKGQVKAMNQALKMSGLKASEIDFVDCHATGTIVGDKQEIDSLEQIFKHSLTISSLKANLGHLITASGAAGVIKILSAMKHGTLPPQYTKGQPVAHFDQSNLELLSHSKPWSEQSSKKAALNNFGFGGNNAQLIIESYDKNSAIQPEVMNSPQLEDLAIVDMAVRSGSIKNVNELKQLLTGQIQQANPKMGQIELDLKKLRFPPLDLEDTLAQQLILLELFNEIEAIEELDKSQTGVIIGMQCDAEIARYGLRWRDSQFEEAIAPLSSAAVLGKMPNMVANRLNMQYDFQGPSFSVSAEENSGLRALEIARSMLSKGELETVIIGAVDFSAEQIHHSAIQELYGTDIISGDSAIILVLKRARDLNNDEAIALLPVQSDIAPDFEWNLTQGRGPLSDFLGHSHAASGLLHLAALALACQNQFKPITEQSYPTPWLPDYETHRVALNITALGGEKTTTMLTAPKIDYRKGVILQKDLPMLGLYSAPTLKELVQQLTHNQQSWQDNEFRVAIYAPDQKVYDKRLQQTISKLKDSSSSSQLGAGIYFGHQKVKGEVACVYAGPGGTYHNMGKDLLLAFPELLKRFHRYNFTHIESAIGYLYHENQSEISPLDKLWGSTFLSLIHAEYIQELLNIKPDAAIGFCSGETNSIISHGIWRDIGDLRQEIQEQGVFDVELGGEFKVVANKWGLSNSSERLPWQSYRVFASKEVALNAINNHEKVHLTIVNGPSDLVISGDPEACLEVIKTLQDKEPRAIGFNIAVHNPVIKGYWEPFWNIHLRKTYVDPSIRFYSAYFGGAYELTPEKVADALTGQTMSRVDFPALIQQAWQDGVRVFIEHGPHSACSKWISQTLTGKEHHVIALDHYHESSLASTLKATAQLFALGISMDTLKLNEKLMAFRAVETPSKPKEILKTFSAHPAPIHLKQYKTEVISSTLNAQVMHKAPKLPSVFARTNAIQLAEPVPKESTGLRPEYTNTSSFNEAHDGSLTNHHENLFSKNFSTISNHYLTAIKQRSETLNDYFTMQKRALKSLLNLSNQTNPINSIQAANIELLPQISAPRVETSPIKKPSTFPLQSTDKKVTISKNIHPLPTLKPPQKKPLSTSPVSAHIQKEPVFNREDLLIHASGKISSIFGSSFEPQDQYPVQVRMPEPPLLLADRVMAINAKSGVLGTGSMVTETDVHEDSWYLHDNRMPAGIMIESGQADLMLISWMGIDLINKGERAYRLLGCEATFHGSLPKPGDTLNFDIHIDGHAKHQDTRLFFFHYDCLVSGRPGLTVREGQAGFFSLDELQQSDGVLWSPEDEKMDPATRVDPPKVECQYTQFSKEQIEAFIDGNYQSAFGSGYELAKTHTWPPRVAGGKMRFIDHISDFSFDGGPWGRGYLRAEQYISPDVWFFDGHFKNDPCMPGTLMFEGCLQVMAFYMTALGYTLEHDGWRFEPIPEEAYKMQCRGQVLPSSKLVIYEIFIEEVHDGPIPKIYADLLCTVDGLKAFHCRKMGLQLVPAWPLDRMKDIEKPDLSEYPCASSGEFKFDYDSLVACAYGQPSHAFGSFYKPFDGVIGAPRLPGPPYHFMSQIIHLEGEIGSLKSGAVAEVLYKVPQDAWYFQDNGYPTMPYSVLCEVGLQPCGWLASYIGGAQCQPDKNWLFRNLDGKGTVHAEVLPDTGDLITRTELTSLSKTKESVLVSFKVTVRSQAKLIYSMTTTFGFFLAHSMENQVGLSTADKHRPLFEKSFEEALSLTPSTHTLKLPSNRLSMLNRITGYWPDGGEAGLGLARAERDIDAADWYFKAHFFQDPVQPGSLGLEAILQLMQEFMLKKDLGQQFSNPRFEPIATALEHVWKYRGQVRPFNKIVTIQIEVLEIVQDKEKVILTANGSLWSDGICIYEVSPMSMAIVEGPPQPPGLDSSESSQPSAKHSVNEHSPSSKQSLETSGALEEDDLAPEEDLIHTHLTTFDPSQNSWVFDHRPTYTKPVLPMMYILVHFARVIQEHCPESKITNIHELEMKNWLYADQPIALKTEFFSPDEYSWSVKLYYRMLDSDLPFKLTATANIITAPDYTSSPTPFPPLENLHEMPSPYETFEVFHGPAFQVLKSYKRNEQGAMGKVEPSLTKIPKNYLNPAVLDSIFHIIPNDQPELWFPIEPGFIAYPLNASVSFYCAPPLENEMISIRVEPNGVTGNGKVLSYLVEFTIDDKVWLQGFIQQVALPVKSFKGMGQPANRKHFIDDRQFIEEVRISEYINGQTQISIKDLLQLGWLEGTLEHIFNLKESKDLKLIASQIAIKEHLAHQLKVHPSTIKVMNDHQAIYEGNPEESYSFDIKEDTGKLVVSVSS